MSEGLGRGYVEKMWNIKPHLCSDLSIKCGKELKDTVFNGLEVCRLAIRNGSFDYCLG